MSSLPNEIFSNISNFLPNDDITDLMLLSRNFNALVTPRLQKIDEEMTTMNQSIKSPTSQVTDGEWISQLNLKQFEPIGYNAKKQMRRSLAILRQDMVNTTEKWNIINVVRFKERMSLERFDDATFLHILIALLSRPEFRQEYNISQHLGNHFQFLCMMHLVPTRRIGI
ncbi:hypothetical protein Ddc_14778 [Ditylenchus destructor]|nr:hypothetical protein Ddc_14778 [Ditylenchus destructor]